MDTPKRMLWKVVALVLVLGTGTFATYGDWEVGDDIDPATFDEWETIPVGYSRSFWYVDAVTGKPVGPAPRN